MGFLVIPDFPSIVELWLLITIKKVCYAFWVQHVCFSGLSAVCVYVCVCVCVRACVCVRDS